MKMSSGKGHLAQFWLLLLSLCMWLSAGVPKELAARYVQQYENKAMFLRIPARGHRQIIYVSDQGPKLKPSNFANRLSFNVGEQVRITDVSFKDDQIRFKIASIDLSRENELIFQFPRSIEENFTQKESFDTTLKGTFVEGLSYADIEASKEEFVHSQIDQLIRQLATLAGTSDEFVTKSILEKNPKYQAAKKEARTTQTQLLQVKDRLRREIKARENLGIEASSAGKKLHRLRQTSAVFQKHRQELSERARMLQRQVDRLEETNLEYERQIQELMESLNMKSASTVSLGKRIEGLSTSIVSLQEERNLQSVKLATLGKQIENVAASNQKLSTDLRRTLAGKVKLEKNIRALTSDQDSLQANYLKLKKHSEILETASSLSAALRLQRNRNETDGLRSADLFLLGQKVGTFEVQIPRSPGHVYLVGFSADSPDTVQFTEEERKLYEALGEVIRVETDWQANNLTFILMPESDGGEAVESIQAVRPREKVEWPWLCKGKISQPETVLLNAHLIDQNGQRIRIDSQEFMVAPAGILDSARQAFSPLSVAAGSLLGFAVSWLVFGFSRGRRGIGATIHNRRYLTQKKL